MATDPPTSAELDTFRAQADRFLAELDEEYYVHFAGPKSALSPGAVVTNRVRVAAIAVPKPRLE